MSEISKRTFWVVLFLTGLVAMYGYGYKSGRNSQVSLDNAIEIAKAQFKCEMVLK